LDLHGPDRGLSFVSGGVVDVLRIPQALEGMTHLGYPAYFMTILLRPEGRKLNRA